MRTALVFNALIHKYNMDEKKIPSAYIIDDTPIAKSGYHIERVSKIYDHSTNSYKTGYKCLTCAFFDGRSTIPVAFEFLRESKKKNLGLTDEQLKTQYQKERDADSPCSQRLQETDNDKITIACNNVKKMYEQDIVGEYAIVDSWFMSERLLVEIRSIDDGAIHVVACAKRGNAQYAVQDKKYNIHALSALYGSKKQYCRKYKCSYIKIKAKVGDIPVLIFIVCSGRNKTIDIIVTTDTSLDFVKCLEIYQIRWNIEVLFKECKQYLGLGKCQCRDFASQIADTSLCYLTYMTLTLDKRVSDYETFLLGF